MGQRDCGHALPGIASTRTHRASASPTRSCSPPAEETRRWWRRSTSSAEYQPKKRKSSAQGSRERSAPPPSRPAGRSAPAPRRPDQPARHLDERRLPRPLGPPQTDKLTAPHLEADAGERLHAAVALATPSARRRDHRSGLRPGRANTFAPRRPTFGDARASVTQFRDNGPC